MRVILCGGGTAGHINPALAIGDKIKKECKDAVILYVGSKDSMEEKLVPKAGYDFKSIRVKGFQRSLSPKNIIKNVKAATFAVTSQFAAKKIIKDFAPDIVIGTGGYVSGPVVLKAAKLGIKTAIHEQNAFPGVTTKLLSKSVDKIMLAVKDAEKYIKTTEKCVVVGNPIREDIVFLNKSECREKLGIPADKKLILSFGGSLGARVINQCATDLLEWYGDREDILHIHGTGRINYDAFMKNLDEKGITPRDNYEIREYIDNMPQLIAAADLVISRAGAVTLSELQAAAKASILIPSPYVAENHQYHNAMAVAKDGGAIVIEEKDYDGKNMINEVRYLLDNPDKLVKMANAASKGAIVDATDRIYKIISKI